MRGRKSPFFVQEAAAKPIARRCDQVGCEGEGLYRAPKTQNLNDYYWFCLSHVSHYNATWNYYRDMSDAEFEKSRADDLTWNRPTWPLGQESPFKKEWDFKSALLFKLTAPPKSSLLSTEAQQALKIFGLKMPLTAANLKQRYNFLVKKYHPDAHLLNKQGEEKLKTVNHAYAILKKILRK